MSEWISVDDRLPEVRHNFSSLCLVAVSISYDSCPELMDCNPYTDIAQLHHSGVWTSWDETIFQYDKRVKITHWMQLPEPPK